jgi:hypothetical protein
VGGTLTSTTLADAGVVLVEITLVTASDVTAVEAVDVAVLAVMGAEVPAFESDPAEVAADGAGAAAVVAEAVSVG